MAKGLIVKEPRFVISAASVKQFPDWDRPEIAFAGRSNVGKSSLLRTLAGQRSLVRVGSRPGRTQQINFFELALGDQDCAFVDLPGYGYAKVPVKVKAEWGALVEQYLAEREQLAGVFLLHDCRREPSEDESELLEWFEDGELRCVTVFTKVDKLAKNRRFDQLNRLQRDLGVKGKPLGFSSTTGEGREALLRRAMGMVLKHRADTPETASEE